MAGRSTFRISAVNATEFEQMRQRIHHSGRCLDNRDYDGFVDLFTLDGAYRIEVDAPEMKSKMTWMTLDHDELRQRFQSAPEQVWRDIETTHLIAVDTIDFEGETAKTSATVSIFRTDDEGRTQVYAVGRYEDAWQRIENKWRISLRVLDLRTRLLPVPAPLPL
jgi:3-phenylpropionate/cinnamic acid dioxygenase small subunit